MDAKYASGEVPEVHDIVKCPQSSRAIIAEITHDHEWLVRVVYGDDGWFSGWCRPHECELLERSVNHIVDANKMVDEPPRETSTRNVDDFESAVASLVMQWHPEQITAMAVIAMRPIFDRVTAERDELRRERSRILEICGEVDCMYPVQVVEANVSALTAERVKSAELSAQLDAAMEDLRRMREERDKTAELLEASLAREKSPCNKS